ncbi:O-antigen ligase family protein [Mesorhizobium sp. M0136]|uniref:O-antigen ligase family protein n=1 Tax=Mesorhizobium sp. M0136 TaxID=2956890 RepID=UPI00333C5A5E
MSIYKDLWAWTFALAIAGYPLIGVASSLTGDETLSIAFRAAVLCLSLLCFFLVDQRKGFGFGSIWLLVLASFYLLKLWLDVEYEVDGSADAMQFALVTGVVPAILLAASTPRWLEANTSLALFVVGALSVAAILWLDYNGSEMLLLDNSGRVSFERLNPISVGHAAVTTLIACYALLQHVDRKSARMVIYTAAGGAFFTLYLSGARGPLVALAACCALFYILRPRFSVMLGCFVVAGGCVLFLALTDITPLLEKFNLIDLGEDRSSEGRLSAISMSWNLFTEHPWLGYGTQLPFVGYPHNLFMEVLQAMGIIGMAIFAVVLFRIYQATSFMAHMRLPLLPLLTTQFLVGAQFSGSIYGNSSLWIVTCVMIFRSNAIKSVQQRRNYVPSPNGFLVPRSEIAR